MIRAFLIEQIQFKSQVGEFYKFVFSYAKPEYYLVLKSEPIEIFSCNCDMRDLRYCASFQVETVEESLKKFGFEKGEVLKIQGKINV